MPNDKIKQIDINGTTYDLEAIPLQHVHGNITNDGKIGSISNLAVHTDTNGVLIASDISTVDPSANGNSTTFIKTINQDAKGKITATKANLPDKILAFHNIIANFQLDIDETYVDYPYRAAITCVGVTDTMIPTVIYKISDVSSGNFSPIAQSYNGGVYLYSKTADQNIQIINIVCFNPD